MGFLQTQTPILLLVLAFGKVTWMLSFLSAFFLSFRSGANIPESTTKTEQANAWQITRWAFLIPQPGAHEHKLWGQEDLRWNPEDSWGVPSWASYLTPLGLSFFICKTWLTQLVCQVLTRAWNTVSAQETGITQTHFRDVLSEGIRAYGDSWQKQTKILILSQNPMASRIMGTMCPYMNEQMS